MASRKTKVHLVLSDIHVPFLDSTCMKAVLKCIDILRPDALHVLGDLMDFDMLSRFVRKPDRGLALQGDLGLAKEVLGLLRGRLGKGRPFILSEGNHEFRLQKYLQRAAPELDGLPALDLYQLLELSKFKVAWRPMRKPYQVGSIWLWHGGPIRARSAYTARAMVERVQGNIIIGHTHRLGVYHETSWGGGCTGWENGCLCQTDMDYLETPPNWQHGFSVIYEKGNLCSVEQVPILEGGKFFLRGELV